jgi:hypothetical protein
MSIIPLVYAFNLFFQRTSIPKLRRNQLFTHCWTGRVYSNEKYTKGLLLNFLL